MPGDKDRKGQKYPAPEGVVRVSVKDIHIAKSRQRITKHVSENSAEEGQDNKAGKRPSFEVYFIN